MYNFKTWAISIMYLIAITVHKQLLHFQFDL
jgi:hypothetical protein